MGIVIGGLAGLALLLLVWCLRPRRGMHKAPESLAKGAKSRTREREAADGQVSQTPQARPRTLQVRVPRLERVCRAQCRPLSHARAQPVQSICGQPLPVCQVGEHTCMPLCQRGVSCPRGSSM